MPLTIYTHMGILYIYPLWYKKKMEGNVMMIKIIGLVIGILLLCAGIYYLVKEKHDAESKKIYGIISLIGVILSAACILLLIF